MNGNICLNPRCEHIKLEGCGIGISFRHCHHPDFGDDPRYIWFMDEDDCPKRTKGGEHR